ncbi:cyclic pyranopterin monophosphate synthase MoaC [Prolixibacter sp. SD074]|jgi:cyclic pyranopterin phosphate synthase|uniref:cyclic pyranopterin monophosphate synthase MoaC n=1 Tax=Prolixibacter sp. SD074 TaxID=2652391 RepID=UPI00126FBC9B|nr:cyclic pyranopterin monophosphate synthase MoaC [Prolixibacter sp. SD074]GET30716.1 cyclic pyranopterin monophosphate synthase accessory protein [Prolixibacter sp. SD074]
MKNRKLSHTDEEGRARMVDVSDKPVQKRRAVASGKILLQPETIRLVKENQMKKGDVITVAEIAGIQAAKRAHELIPLCHPLQLSKVKVACTLMDEGIEAIGEVVCSGQTGVEMEALTAVQVALLTVYDMCKAVDKQMIMQGIRLNEKTKV